MCECVQVDVDVFYNVTAREWMVSLPSFQSRNSQGMAGQWWWPVISLGYTRDVTKRSATPLQTRSQIGLSRCVGWCEGQGLFSQDQCTIKRNGTYISTHTHNHHVVTIQKDLTCLYTHRLIDVRKILIKLYHTINRLLWLLIVISIVCSIRVAILDGSTCESLQ